MLKDLQRESLKVGLKINLSKTKCMSNSKVTPKNIKLHDTEIELVNDYIYLGQRFSLKENNQMGEINRRIQLGWAAFGKHTNILRSRLPISMKRKLFNQCILPTMTYASETWSLTNKILNRLRTTQRAMERSMMNITRRDKWSNTRLRNSTKVEDIIERVKDNKHRWAGHIIRRQDSRWTKRTTDWIPREGKRSRGRPMTTTWETDLRSYWVSAVNWRRKAQDRQTWKKHAEAFVLQLTEHRL